MKVTSINGQSVSSMLVNIVKSALPSFNQTGLAKDLTKISSDPKSKGKAIIFNWRKSSFRLTENLKVAEITFCNTLMETELSKEAAEIIVKSLQMKDLQITEVANSIPVVA